MLKNTLNTGTFLIADLCRNVLYIMHQNTIYEFIPNNYSILNFGYHLSHLYIIIY